MGRQVIGLSFYIGTPTQITAVPVEQDVVNSFDLHGDLVTLQRIAGESNVEYRNRLWDVSVHPGGPAYSGVVSSLARDLGMLRQSAISIDLKLNSGGSPIASNPRVDILANRVVLYSDWRPNGTAVIDREIRTYQLGDTGYYLDDLAAAINQSDYFSAVLIEDIRPNTISSTLVRSTSDIVIHDNYIHTDKYTDLSYTYIIQNSLYFSESDIFIVEVSGTPAADGEYVVDYTTGEVTSYTLPSGDGSCSYHAALFPLEIDSVPIQIFTLQDDDFQSELFNKETLDSGAETNALPNAEGSEIFHQLYMETEVFWGE